MSLTSAPPAQAARLAPTAPTRPHPGPEPIAPSRRDAAIDAVRAVSLLGVVVLHALMVPDARDRARCAPAWRSRASRGSPP